MHVFIFFHGKYDEDLCSYKWIFLTLNDSMRIYIWDGISSHDLTSAWVDEDAETAILKIIENQRDSMALDT